MAKDYAQLHLRIWNDDEFRALTPTAQHLYFVLISQPGLERTGVNDWKPGRIKQFAKGWTLPQINQAAAELIDKLFILVDTDTDEYLIRSYVKNDGFMKQENLAVNMARSFSVVSSNGIRGVIIHELHRLKADQPDLNGWRSKECLQLLEREPIDPRVYPCGHPTVDPPLDPQVDPQPQGGLDPHIHPPIDPTIDPRVEGQHDPAIDPPLDPLPPTATETSTFQREQEKGDQFKSMQSHTNEFPPFFAPNEKTKNQTPDAWSTDADPRCHKHANTPPDEVPPCRECAKARQWFTERNNRERAEAREEIDQCPHCDERGIAQTTDQAGAPITIRCNHTPPEPIHRTYDQPPHAKVPNWRQHVKPHTTHAHIPETPQNTNQPEIKPTNQTEPTQKPAQNPV